MPIPADYVLRAGHYKVDATGVTFYACNCSSQPANKTLRHIGANRHLYSVFPAPAAKPAEPIITATFTPAELANGAQS